MGKITAKRHLNEVLSIRAQEFGAGCPEHGADARTSMKS